MSSLFDKINTLLNAQVNDFLGRNPKSPLARIRLNDETAEKNPRRSVQALRRRLDEALAYEDELQAKIDARMQTALELDDQVDARLRAGDEIGARRLQGQLNMKQQQIAIAESELRDHRRLTQHLMQEMTTLEMALKGQARRGETSSASSGKAQSGGIRIPIDGAASVRGAVSDKLNETRSSLENLLNNSPVPEAPEISQTYKKFDIIEEPPDPRQPKPKGDKGDMKARLSRLSKPDEDEG